MRGEPGGSGRITPHERAAAPDHRPVDHRRLAGTGQGQPRRPRGALGQRLDRAGHLRLRPQQVARAGLLDRHPAADRLRLAARGPRVQLHPHRRRRALPAHARPRGLLPDGLGRQRPAHRAPRAELLRRALRHLPALRRGLRPAARGRRGQERQGRRPAADLAPQLRRALRATDGRGRGPVRGAVAPARPLGRLVAPLPDDRRAFAGRRPARLPAQPRAWRGLPGRGPRAVGRDLPDGRRPGRARGPRLPRALPPRRLPPRRGRHPRPHRDHAPRAHPGRRRPHRAPGRRALPAPVRHDGARPAVRHRDPRPRAPRRRARQGRRHRDVLHLRRPDGRAVVARAAAADPLGPRSRRPPARRDPGVDHQRGRPRALRRAGRQDDVLGPDRRRRRPARDGRPGRRADGDAAQGELLREGRQAARDRHEPPVVHPQRRARRGQGRGAAREAAGARHRARLPPRLHEGALRELGRRAQRRLAHLPPALLRRLRSRCGTPSTPRARSTTTTRSSRTSPCCRSTRRATRPPATRPSSAGCPAASSARPT